MTLVGVISDTHGWLRPEAVEFLRGSALIIHAGDVGAEEVLHGLQGIAPVRAVRGNVDTAPWARALPEVDLVEVAGRRIHVVHDLAELDIDPVAAGVDAVVYGHSHIPRSEDRDGVLYLNPGSAGPRRFRLPISLARLAVGQGPLSVEFHEIEG